jgi:hypothetical protein
MSDFDLYILKKYLFIPLLVLCIPILGAQLCSAAFGMILENHMGLPVSIFSVKIAALGCLKRVTGSIFKMSKSL